MILNMIRAALGVCMVASGGVSLYHWLQFWRFQGPAPMAEALTWLFVGAVFFLLLTGLDKGVEYAHG